jgi:VanZ family protein
MRAILLPALDMPTPHRLLTANAWLLLALAWGLAVWWLLTLELPSSGPASPWMVEALQPGLDKVAHAGLFLVQAVIGARAAAQRMPLRWALSLTVALCLALGLATELRQGLVPGRSADVLDFAADGAGALVGALALGLNRRSTPAPAARPPYRSP